MTAVTTAPLHTVASRNKVSSRVRRARYMLGAKQLMSPNAISSLFQKQSSWFEHLYSPRLRD